MRQNLRFALVDLHGSCLGYYATREEAEADRRRDECPDELGIIEVPQPEKSAWRRAGLRMLTRISEQMPGGYR